jgi:hypothetical protein
VRRYSYRKDPELPAGNFPRTIMCRSLSRIARSAKTVAHPVAGLPAKFTAYIDTDYEYALNPVAAKYGGGTEVWRMRVPGMSPNTIIHASPNPSSTGRSKPRSW